jgi:hypothetical protein
MLAAVLSGFTATPSECWFGVWEGYGGTPFQRGMVPLIAMPQRKMALLRGPLHAAGTAFSGWDWPDSASLWWPDDRAWCVATDIDLMSTYVGGSAECIDAVLGDTRLEAFAVTVDQTVHWQSDTLNPTPDPPPVGKVSHRRVWHRKQAGEPGPAMLRSRGPRPAPPGDTPGR